MPSVGKLVKGMTKSNRFESVVIDKVRRRTRGAHQGGMLIKSMDYSSDSTFKGIGRKGAIK